MTGHKYKPMKTKPPQEKLLCKKCGVIRLTEPDFVDACVSYWRNGEKLPGRPECEKVDA